jgi:hypothetical protein
MKLVSFIRVLPGGKRGELAVNPELVLWVQPWSELITTLFMGAGPEVEVVGTHKEVLEKLSS